MKPLQPILFICFFLFSFLSCQKNPTSQETEKKESYFIQTSQGIQTGGVRMIPITTEKGNFKVWTKHFGNNSKIKVLLLNGGPGIPHDYFECMESFLPAENIEFIYYDQLGSGNSDNPNDTALWDLNRYVEEVEQVRIALNLDSTNFFLLGHSWGGILAMQYALKYQQHLKGLIIYSMMSSGPAYGKYADEVLSKQMDPVVLADIRNMEARKDFDNPKYMELLYSHYYTAHILRQPLDKWPEPVTRAFSKMNGSLYVNMQGPSEFGISGKLSNWDVSDLLKTIAVPALVIGAKYDTMDPEFMKWMSKEFPAGTFLYCPEGSHMSMYDDQQVFMKGLIEFLKHTSGTHS